MTLEQVRSAAGMISIKGVIIGTIALYVAIPFFDVAAIIGVEHIIGIADFPKAQRLAAFNTWMEPRPPLYLLIVFCRSCAAIVSGYIAAWLAKHDQVLNGTFTTLTNFGGGLYALIATPLSFKFLSILGWALLPLFGAAGGYIRLRQDAHRAAALT